MSVTVECEFLMGQDICLMASGISGCPATTNQSACAVCISHALPKQINTVTVSLALNSLDGRPHEQMKVIAEHGHFLRRGPALSQEDRLSKILEENGVGSQLWKLLSRLGIQHHPDCSCLLLAETMNSLGPEGCNKEREKILALMHKNQDKYGWNVHLLVGAKALSLSIRHPKEWGWILTISPLDPLPGLLDKAIALTEAD